LPGFQANFPGFNTTAHQLQTISDVPRKWFVAKVAHLVEGVLQESPVTDGFKVHNHLDFLWVIINCR